MKGLKKTILGLELLARREFSLAARIKLFLQFTMPGIYNKILRKWGRNNGKFRHFAKVISEKNGLTVADGPFAGMKYVLFPSSFNIAPKLLGCYELELRPIIRQAAQNNYKSIINIGCADGYYAVGVALRLPNAKVFAFEKDPLCKKLCQELARVNEVTDRITVSGACEIKDLNLMVLDNALIICDCEGYEINLLRPDLIAGLKTCDILVELHDIFDPDTSQTIFARFKETHNIEIISSSDRNPDDYPVLDCFNADDRRLALSEFRPGKMQWAFMESRHKYLK